MVQVHLSLNEEEMAVSAIKERFQLNTLGSVYTLVGNRTGDFFLVDPLKFEWAGVVARIIQHVAGHITGAINIC